MKRTLRLVFIGMGVAACATGGRPTMVSTVSSSAFVDDGGEGSDPPILFVHGNGGSSEQWRGQLEHFRSSGRRAAAIDLPGFGRSPAPANGSFSLDSMATVIDRVVSAIGLRRFVIIGHSYGGAVVATYAARHPEKVAGVVYVDAAATRLQLDPQQQEQLAAALRTDKMQFVRGWFAPMLAPSPVTVRDAVLGAVDRTSVDALLGALLSLTDYDPQALVPAYDGPRLAVVARDLENPLSFQAQFPDVDAVAIAGAGHWLMLDKPDELNAALDRFLATVP